MNAFKIPGNIYYGTGAVRNIASLDGSRALICIGNHMKESSLLKKVISLLQRANMVTEVLDGIKTEPVLKTVSGHIEQVREFQPDWIIAIGGGAVLDFAKAIWVLYENQEVDSVKDYQKMQDVIVGNKARFCAIPTTCGSGSEMSQVFVLKDNDTDIKIPVYNTYCMANVVILDPAFVKTLPNQIIAQTGFDAFTHAIEAYVSKGATVFTDAMAEKALKLIYENIVQAYELDKVALEKMQQASTIAGIAFSNASLDLCHAISHKVANICEEVSINHGCANSIVLPKVMEFNSRDKKVCSKLAQIVDILQLEGNSYREKVQNLILSIIKMSKELNLPSSLLEYLELRLSKDKIEQFELVVQEKINQIAPFVLEDLCLLTNPVNVTENDIVQIMSESIYTNNN